MVQLLENDKIHESIKTHLMLILQN